MKTSTYNVRSDTVSKVKKSQATMPPSLDAEELGPGGTCPSGRRSQPGPAEQHADGRRADTDTQHPQLA